jgi:hypothetical protein
VAVGRALALPLPLTLGAEALEDGSLVGAEGGVHPGRRGGALTSPCRGGINAQTYLGG